MYFTEKQLRIMEFIQQFRDERGISPTLEEIASNFGVTKITVYEHINQLERKGALKREKFRARSIELITSVEERKARYSMPLMGNFREGLPIEATEEREDLNISEMLPYGRNFFALRVCGDELKQDHLTDGDLIIAEKREGVTVPVTSVSLSRDGDSVLLITDGQTHRTAVETGIRDGDRIEITKGLSAGDLIVAKAGAFVRDGDRIKPVVEGDPETTAAIAD